MADALGDWLKGAADSVKDDPSKPWRAPSAPKVPKVGALPKPKASPNVMKPPVPSDAWDQAEELAKRNRGIARKTRPLRQALPGQGE